MKFSLCGESSNLMTLRKKKKKKQTKRRHSQVIYYSRSTLSPFSVLDTDRFLRYSNRMCRRDRCLGFHSRRCRTICLSLPNRNDRNRVRFPRWIGGNGKKRSRPF